MAKATYSEFKFRKSDTIGAASAEDDTEFLEKCFVETDEYEILKNIGDIRQIVLGRTGSGKSALFERLKQEEQERVVVLEPQELALTYVSNSRVIGYFSDLGVNLDPFYKLLWRHVLTIEVLKMHFEPHAGSSDGGIWAFLNDKFSGQSRRDKDAKQAIQYLRKWGGKFWSEVEHRVKEITSKMEGDLSSQLGAELKSSVLSGRVSSGAKSSLSSEQKAEVIDRGQRVVSEAQVQDLSKIRQLLQAVLTDRQKCYYVLVDRLDENWVEDKWVRLFFVGGPISLFGGGEAGGNWIRQGVVRSGGGSGGRRYFCRQRPMGDFRWSSRAS